MNIRNKKIGILIIFLGLIAGLVGVLWWNKDYPIDTCNVLAFSINGYLTTYIPEPPDETLTDISSSGDIVDGLQTAQSDPDIKAVILSVDSGGGDGVAGEEIANALKILGKPSVAVIRSVGASAAYWAATGADKIYASKVSDVGSIGVTQSYLDQSAKDTKDGYKYIELTSAKYKGLGDPSRPLTAEEKTIILADLKKTHNVFVQAVATNRKMDIKEVEKLANGRTYLGEDALNYDLIDDIGDLTSATQYLEKQIGERADICWY